MAARSDSRTMTGNFVHYRASLVPSASQCKLLFGWQWNTKCVTGTVVNLIQTILNGGRRRSVDVDWKIQHRTKRVTLKIVNIQSGPNTSVTDGEQNTPGSPPLLSFEGEMERDLDLIDLVTEHDALSANANTVSHGQNCTTNAAGTSLSGLVTKRSAR